MKWFPVTQKMEKECEGGDKKRGRRREKEREGERERKRERLDYKSIFVFWGEVVSSDSQNVVDYKSVKNTSPSQQVSVISDIHISHPAKITTLFCRLCIFIFIP